MAQKAYGDAVRVTKVDSNGNPKCYSFIPDVLQAVEVFSLF